MQKETREPHEMITEREKILAKLKGNDPEIKVYLPRNTKPINGRVRLEIDFETPQQMIEWFESSLELVLPSTAAIYAKDSLDAQISDGNTFIVKRHGDRPDDFRLHIERTYREGV